LPWTPDVKDLDIKSIFLAFDGPPENSGSVVIYLTVKNRTTYYIKYISALCSTYDVNGNRITKGEVIFHGKSDIAPNNEAVFKSYVSSYYSYDIDLTKRVECELADAGGSK
jgi:hypothetical protein